MLLYNIIKKLKYANPYKIHRIINPLTRSTRSNTNGGRLHDTCESATKAPTATRPTQEGTRPCTRFGWCEPESKEISGFLQRIIAPYF
jgi:hypothetical protein